jgi:hypothetical protein
VGKEFWKSHKDEKLNLNTLEDVISLMCQEAKELEDSRGMNWSPKKTKALAPGENSVQFGDEQGTLLGEIYDYILREGGESKRFKWRFDFYNR